MKNTPAVPDSYAAWRHCIILECGIPLTILHALTSGVRYPSGRRSLHPRTIKLSNTLLLSIKTSLVPQILFD